jgi:23S rRNA pseudouridine955/2504/2580 synthase
MAHIAYDVTEASAGRRADALVRALLPELTPPEIRGVFARRDVKLDGVRIRPDVRVCSGQHLEVFYMPPAAVQVDTVYRDGNVIVVNKRAGISVDEDGRGLPSLTTLVNASLPGETGAVPCHRLDNQTCGLVVFALNPSAEETLTQAFKERTLDKRYLCLVKGQPKPPEAVCRAWLKKDAKAAKVTVTDHEVPGSRPITTGYETLEAGNVSRLRVHLITGRTHQIRAHLAALGHPILGDDLYGDRTLNRAMRAQGKLMLCAASLTFPDSFPLAELAGKTLTAPCPF